MIRETSRTRKRRKEVRKIIYGILAIFILTTMIQSIVFVKCVKLKKELDDYDYERRKRYDKSGKG